MSRKKAILAGFLTHIIFIALIILVIFMVFTFILSKFAGGEFCHSRFVAEVNKLIQEAATTYGNAFTYTSFKIEDCIRDVYVTCDNNNNKLAYTYTGDNKERFIDLIYFERTDGSSIPIKINMVNCGAPDKNEHKMQSGYNMVKITERTIDCQFPWNNDCSSQSQVLPGGAP
jgi:hypothetical protein